MSEIKMDYGMMAEMKAEFQRGAEELDRTLHEVQKLADLIDEDGLKGMAGDAFAETLREAMARKITELRDKFEELGRDIQHAVDSMREADDTTQGEVGL